MLSHFSRKSYKKKVFFLLSGHMFTDSTKNGRKAANRSKSVFLTRSRCVSPPFANWLSPFCDDFFFENQRPKSVFLKCWKKMSWTKAFLKTERITKLFSVAIGNYNSSLFSALSASSLFFEWLHKTFNLSHSRLNTLYMTFSAQKLDLKNFLCGVIFFPLWKEVEKDTF